MSTLYVTHPACLAHENSPGHPEQPARLAYIEKALSDATFDPLVRELAPIREDYEEAVVRAHSKPYFDAIDKVRPTEEGTFISLDGDTGMNSASWEASQRAIGGALMAVDQVVAGKAKNAFCAVRPCGHHAEKETPMGFCFFNNAAIAGLYARAKHGLDRIAVVDFDVHHGNGTQDIYWNDKDLFFGSTHQMPLYPGTGDIRETGVGNVFNAPLKAGDGKEPFEEAFESRILPALRNFHPDLIIISAGFDAHAADPLAGLRLQEEDFRWATGKLADIADKQSEGRIVSLLEGGYDLDALGRSVAAHVSMLMQAGS